MQLISNIFNIYNELDCRFVFFNAFICCKSSIHLKFNVAMCLPVWLLSSEKENNNLRRIGILYFTESLISQTSKILQYKKGKISY